MDTSAYVNDTSGSRKRPRVEGDTCNDQHETRFTIRGDLGLRRHPELWYPDGNVVIVSKDMSFRVYGGLLAQNSPIFADMLSLDQPGSAEKIDGCPVVRLADQPEDLEVLLSTLYQRKYLKSTGTTRCIPLLAILQLSDKYCIDALKEECLQELNAYFPVTGLDAWNATDANRKSFLSGSPGTIILLVIVAAKMDLEVLLLAIYECCQLDSGDIFKGYTHSDGTVEQLPWGIMAAVVRFRERLQYWTRYGASAIDSLEDKIAGCPSRTYGRNCLDNSGRSTFSAAITAALRQPAKFSEMSNVASMFEDTFVTWLNEREVCEKCREGSMRKHKDWREAMFKLYVLQASHQVKEWMTGYA